MSYLLDSSSIFKAIRQEAVEALPGNHTLELTRYELGNILWKEYALRGRATGEELKGLSRLVKQVLSLMEVASIACREEQILDLAEGLRLTFYDASYVYLAAEKGLPLVTEDSNLREKARAHVKALKLDEML